VTSTPLPTFGRGRGTFLFSPVSSIPRPSFGNLMSGDGTARGVSYHVPHTQALQGGDASGNHLAGIATQIRPSIGETIASCIESCLGSGMGSISVGSAGNTVSNPSLLNVVLRSETKEPVSFKGNGHDAHTVQEWEGVMMTYLKKKRIPVAVQAEEVLSNLSGRAREVVRVGLRSKPSLSLSGDPHPIFEILKQHFSDTVSSEMLLADFYATLPRSGENLFDYWLRLNRAMEGQRTVLKGRIRHLINCLVT